jgi:Zn-dependent metalloprotease
LQNKAQEGKQAKATIVKEKSELAANDADADFQRLDSLTKIPPKHQSSIFVNDTQNVFVDGTSGHVHSSQQSPAVQTYGSKKTAATVTSEKAIHNKGDTKLKQSVKETPAAATPALKPSKSTPFTSQQPDRNISFKGTAKVLLSL